MNKNYNCNTPSKYIDVTKLDVDPFESANALMGIDNCGNVKVVEKPNVTDLGDGNKALFDDGEYKEVYTKEDIDNKNSESEDTINESLKEVNESIESIDKDLQNHKEDQHKVNESLDKKIKVLGDEAEKEHTEFNTKLSNLKSNVDKIESDYKSKDESILEKLNQEILDRKEGDINIISDIKIANNNIDALKDNVNNSVEDINTKIDKEADKLNLRIDDEINNRETVIKRVDVDIDRVEDDIKGIKEDYIKGSVADGKYATKDSLNATNEKVNKNTVNIEKNRLDIDSIKSNVSDKEHFRGYFASNDQIKNLSHSVKGDYAYSAETGTKWIYNGETWTDSTVLVPDKVTPASNTLPLVDGEADAGTEELYARGDHRHPSDPTKVDIDDVIDKSSMELILKNIDKEISLCHSGIDYNEENIEKLETKVDAIDLTPYAIKDEVSEQINNIIKMFEDYDKSPEVDAKIKEAIEALGKLVTVTDLNNTIKDWVPYFEDLLSKKVDKRAGYGLSQKDYTNEIHKRLLSWDMNYYYTKRDVENLLRNKVAYPESTGTYLRSGTSTGDWVKSDVFDKTKYSLTEDIKTELDNLKYEVELNTKDLIGLMRDELDEDVKDAIEGTNSFLQAQITSLETAINKKIKSINNQILEMQEDRLNDINKYDQQFIEMTDRIEKLESELSGSSRAADSILYGADITNIE